MWILFPHIAEVPVDRAKEYALAHNRLFNLIERKRDFSQPTVPDKVQSFAQAITGLNEWKRDECTYIFYRDDESVNKRSDAIVQRVDSADSTSLCYLQAPAVLQRCLIAKYSQADGPVGMLDINQYLSKNMKSYQLFRHFFTRGGNSIEILRSILTTGSYADVHDTEVYIVPISSILGRLPLVPAGDHGTIPAAMRTIKQKLFKYGECDKDGRPGSGSKLYYINPWAMCWPSDHPKRPLTG